MPEQALWGAQTQRAVDNFPISGLPMIYVNGQAGLMDVVPHPDYAANGWIYLSYSEQLTKADGTRHAVVWVPNP